MNAQDGLHTYRRKCVLFWQKDNSDLNRDSSEISWNNSVVSVLTEDTQHTNLLSSYLSDKMKMWPNLGQIFSTIASEVWVCLFRVGEEEECSSSVCCNCHNKPRSTEVWPAWCWHSHHSLLCPDLFCLVSEKL